MTKQTLEDRITRLEERIETVDNRTHFSFKPGHGMSVTYAAKKSLESIKKLQKQVKDLQSRVIDPIEEAMKAADHWGHPCNPPIYACSTKYEGKNYTARARTQEKAKQYLRLKLENRDHDKT